MQSWPYTVVQNASTKGDCSLGEMKSYPSPPHCIFSLADIWSLDSNFPKEKYIQTGTEVALEDKFQENYFSRHLPPMPFLAVCKHTVLLRQISDQKQPYRRAFFLYTITQIHPEVWEGGDSNSCLNHLVKQKRKFSRTCGEKSLIGYANPQLKIIPRMRNTSEL